MSLRADGRENRLRLIDVAEEVFANQGFDVPLETIAKQAGVSRMTLYRHFKDHETLYFAALERNVVKLENHAEELKKDPNAFTKILDMMLAIFATNQGMVEGLIRQKAHEAQLDSLKKRIIDLLSESLTRAQSAGLVKKGLQKEDLSIMMCMFCGASVDGTAKNKTDRVQRALQILQSGFLSTGDDDLKKK